jgi:hypothetical protein
MALSLRLRSGASVAGIPSEEFFEVKEESETSE